MIRLFYFHSSRLLLKTICVSCVVLLAGCVGAGTSTRTATSTDDDFSLFRGVTTADQPVKLGQKRNNVLQASLRMRIDEAVAKRAIENFRINKGEQSGPYQYAGADLNGDGKAELMVYYTGEGWCASTGCTLAVLAKSKHRYRKISTIRRVKAPIFIAETSTNGWRDLYVHTGRGEASDAPQVKLKFGGNGYPGNAITQTVRPKDVVTIGEVIIEHRS